MTFTRLFLRQLFYYRRPYAGFFLGFLFLGTLLAGMLMAPSWLEQASFRRRLAAAGPEALTLQLQSPTSQVDASAVAPIDYLLAESRPDPAGASQISLPVDEEVLLSLLPQAAPLAEAIRNLQANLATRFIILQTPLPDLLDAHRANLVTGRVAQQAFRVQILFLFFVAAFLIAPVTNLPGRETIPLLNMRGYTKLSQVWFVNGPLLPLIVLAGILAPFVARIFLRLVGGDVPRLAANTIVLPLFALLIWWLAGSIATFRQLRQGVSTPVWRAQPAPSPTWIPGLLLLVAGLALTGQLWLADPAQFQTPGSLNVVLLLGPVAIVTGLVLLLPRFLPFLVRPVGTLAARGPGLPAFLSLRRAQHAPVPAGRVFALAALPVAVLVLAVSLHSAINRQQQATARFLAGADVRLQLDSDTPPTPPGETAENQAATRFWLARLTPDAGQQAATIAALDPDTVASVVRYPAGTSSAAVADLAAVLEKAGTGERVPAFFSTAAVPGRAAVGDTVTYIIPDRRRRTMTFEIVGIVEAFPGLTGRFILTSHEAFESGLATAGAPRPGNAEWWLATAVPEKIMAAYPGRVVASIVQEEQALAADLWAAVPPAGWLAGGLLLLGLMGVGLVWTAGEREAGYPAGVWAQLGLTALEEKRVSMLTLFIPLSGGVLLGLVLGLLLQPVLDHLLALAA